MSAKLPQFRGSEGPDRVEGWLREIEKAFRIIDVPDKLKVIFDTYILVDDAEDWWGTQLEVQFGGEEPIWKEFVNSLNRPLCPR